MVETKLYYTEAEHRKSLKDEVGFARAYCLLGGADWYPVLVDELPSCAGEVHDYIRRKAKQDLPATQFLGKEDSSVIGGSLGYRGKLFEIVYKKTDSSISLGALTRADAERADVVLTWHSDPVSEILPIPEGSAIVNYTIAIQTQKFLNHNFGNKQSYVIVYSPKFDQCYWIRANKISESTVF